MTSGTPRAGCLGAGRPLRADAQRNLGRVLVAAEELFASHGVGVSMDEIASRAGVGVGTLYRHFPGGKADLVEAVVLDRLAKFVTRAEQLSEGPDACSALFTLVRELAKLAVEKKDLTDELARSGVDKDSLAPSSRVQLEAIMRGLWERAQADRTVRGDLDFEDLSSLVMATCVAADRQGQPSVDRLVGVMCDGLKDGAARA